MEWMVHNPHVWTLNFIEFELIEMNCWVAIQISIGFKTQVVTILV